ncbi:somatostatin receptor type 2-like [Varroa destructor]|uniref:G-protein coupled receptors family 1 profile domain-containing protein n=1 Tax=Varroa destructor TaxID=109461 RepID=A0A7M7JKJ9_VARDE|nr:somatostatin receptor type 2-like [Varroa destructor]XP_022653393.1 somatostatin receptor type 2-like [Varroa destructor]XP_022653394.1 somatostatin receptor type 2-like [Varroa destructor]
MEALTALQNVSVDSVIRLANDEHVYLQDLLSNCTNGKFNMSEPLNLRILAEDPQMAQVLSNCSLMEFSNTEAPLAMVRITTILYLIICLVGLCGNSLVIYVVFRFSKMQTVTNMYIFNLALADVMFLFGLPFLITTMTTRDWIFGQAMCKIYMTTTSINQFTSSLLLTVMSADRYIAVCHPISSPRYRTPFIAKFVCLTAWTVSALLMVPVYLYATAFDIPKESTDGSVSSRKVCNIYWMDTPSLTGQTAFTLYSFFLGFAIPLVLILVFYFLVIFKLSKVGPKTKSKNKKRSHRKVTYLVLTVITCYIFCWLPYWVGQIIIILRPPSSNVQRSQFQVAVFLLSGCLAYANSAINPVLYAFLSDNFKKSFTKAFTCASKKDVNAQLHVENSVFPGGRTRGGSTRGPNGASGTNGTRNGGALPGALPNGSNQLGAGLLTVHKHLGISLTTGPDIDLSTNCTRSDHCGQIGEPGNGEEERTPLKLPTARV